MTRCSSRSSIAIDLLPGFVEGEAAAHHLQAQVIFLVDHQADGFLRHDGDAARPIGGGQFAADELAFDEELAIERRQIRQVDVAQARVDVELGDAFAQHGLRSPPSDSCWRDW